MLESVKKVFFFFISMWAFFNVQIVVETDDWINNGCDRSLSEYIFENLPNYKNACQLGY